MTPKQEAFARAYVETGLATEAYRRAYSAENMGQGTLEVEASRLLAHPKVSLRVSQLQAKLQKRHDITVDKLTDMAMDAFKLAMKDGINMPAAAMSAVMGLGKLHGLITEKREVRHVSGAEDLDDNELANLARSGSPRASEQTAGSPKSH